PHTVQLMPAEASGCRNYQGIAWYRKHFVIPQEAKGRNVTLHFEAIMGKQTIYVNGQKVKEHEGGYLPITVNLTDVGCSAGDDCVVAVKADNSDDKTYPPGKKQMTLDFAYHGGIYRDVWLIAKQKVAITDAVEEAKVAGGGIFVHYANISNKSAEVYVNTEVRNSDKQSRTITVENQLSQQTKQTKLTLKPGEARTVTQRFVVKNPKLWSPETPYLYQVATRIKEGRQSLDGGSTRIGIRSFEFRGKDGFWLNGQRYHQLVGANRHQDFAYVGNALPNSQQWRDAKRLRDAGFTIIRTAHYPQDPAFMDACDELGLFIIVATPGWQYWNKEQGWAEKVHQNTRSIIRRDRNHPCVLMWEPILNETRYPEEFALQALQITKDEYPYPYRPVAAADVHSAGVADHYDVVYGWPGDDFKEDKPKQCIFTREFGELVDDWYAHNNLNRASRSWGERPMLTQAMSLFKSTDELYHTTGQFIGGCQWHPFDHQRGYHPDPYWGGIYDAFRQPKYAYYMFRSQTAHDLDHPVAESGPM
ncbi:MAG: glycoside hydrolase family 2, partial [Prevotella sp.]|nr:glycoside hydrolase family 2 [Prevotella sp.]